MIAVFFSPLAFLGCGGGTPDGGNVTVGDATKSEVQARAASYKTRALNKSKKAPGR